MFYLWSQYKLNSLDIDLVDSSFTFASFEQAPFSSVHSENEPSGCKHLKVGLSNSSGINSWQYTLVIIEYLLINRLVEITYFINYYRKHVSQRKNYYNSLLKNPIMPNFF